MAGTRASGRRPTEASAQQFHQSQADAGRYILGVPPVPDGITADPLAVQYFHAFAERLVRRGTLTTDYGEMLGLLARVTADIQRTTQEHAAEGFASTVENVGPKGGVTVQPHPLVKVIAGLRQELRTVLAEFGLSPMTARKVLSDAGAPADADPFAEFDGVRVQ